MTSRRQKTSEETWLARLGERLGNAKTAKDEATVWWDEFRRVMDQLSEPDRDQIYRAATEHLKRAVTQRRRR